MPILSMKRPSILTQASSKVENGMANSAAPGTTSLLESAPNASTNLAAQIQIYKFRYYIVHIKHTFTYFMLNNKYNLIPS